MVISRRQLVPFAAVIAFLCMPAAYGDVWQRGGDGELTLHRTLDHFQRARRAADWRVPTAPVLATRRQQYAELIDQMSTLYGVHAPVVHAIIEVESAYDTQAVSRAGAQGLMQLMPKTVERFSVVDPLNPEQNIEAGIRYLQLLIREFETLDLVLAAYNAGEDAVRQYDRQVPPYPETRAYVDRVMLVIHRQSDTGQ